MPAHEKIPIMRRGKRVDGQKKQKPVKVKVTEKKVEIVRPAR